MPVLPEPEDHSQRSAARGSALYLRVVRSGEPLFKEGEGMKRIDFRQFGIRPVKVEPAHGKTINPDKAFAFRWQHMDKRIRGMA